MGMEQRLHCVNKRSRRKITVIHIGQLKVLVEKVAAKADRQDLKKGIISAGEMSIIKKYIEKKLKIKADDIRNIEILKKSVDARKKEQLSFVYQLDIECDNEKKIVSRYKKNDVSLRL